MTLIKKLIGLTLNVQKRDILSCVLGAYHINRILTIQRSHLITAQRSHTTDHRERDPIQHQQQQQQLLQNDKTKEVEHHAQLASEWWNVDGPLRGLHALNEIRVPFIRDGLIARGCVDSKLLNTPYVLKDQHILDVGCGGGILSEQLARLSATVTGIDLGEDLIQTAREHATAKSPELLQLLNYKIEPIELHVKDNLERYDAVVVSEVLEHITDKVAFLTACVQSLKPGGSIFITTLNKTLPMWIGGVLLGEYVLNLVPKGTHHWDKMISPLDVQRILDALNCQTVLVNGSTYEFWRNSWRWINSTSMCYALQAVKSECN